MSRPPCACGGDSDRPGPESRPKVLAGLLVLGAEFLISRWFATWLGRGLRHFEMEPPARLLMVRIARLLIVIPFPQRVVHLDNRRE